MLSADANLGTPDYTYCTIYQIQKSSLQNYTAELNKDFIRDFTYQGLAYVPWEDPTDQILYHVRSRYPCPESDISGGLNQEVILWTADDRKKVRYRVRMSQFDKISNSTSAAIEIFEDGMIQIKPDIELFKNQACIQ